MPLPNRSLVARRSRSRKRAISVESATTEVTRLPGLEVAETKAEVKPEHWIERGPSKRLMLFSGRSHPELAQRIAQKLGIQVGDVSLRTFASGLTYCRYEESMFGADVVIVQTSSPGGDLAVLQKDRPAHNVARVTNVIGDIEGKCAVMTDDMADTAGTLVAGAEFLKRRGAKRVFACATHGIFSPPAIERIEASALDSVIVTDTVPIDPLTKPERVTVLTVADILAETIHNVFPDDSVSAIFGDMNALF